MGQGSQAIKASGEILTGSLDDEKFAGSVDGWQAEPVGFL